MDDALVISRALTMYPDPPDAPTTGATSENVMTDGALVELLMASLAVYPVVSAGRVTVATTFFMLSDSILCSLFGYFCQFAVDRM